MMEQKLTSGIYTLSVKSRKSGYGLCITADGIPLYTADTPCYVFIKKNDAYPAAYASAYTKTEIAGDTLVAYGETLTPAGSRIAFTDRYSAEDGGTFALDRHVEVLKAVTDLEWGFATKAYLQPVNTPSLDDIHCFAPGVWYLKNEYVPPHFMGYQKEIR